MLGYSELWELLLCIGVKTDSGIHVFFDTCVHDHFEAVMMCQFSLSVFTYGCIFCINNIAA